MTSIPILTYQSLNIDGNDYLGNDHVAFREDLSLLTSLGWRIVSLDDVTRILIDSTAVRPTKSCAITFDDGTNFDFEDLPHPSASLQRGMLNIMQDFALARPGAQSTMHATSFVIASTEARNTMDRACLKSICPSRPMREEVNSYAPLFPQSLPRSRATQTDGGHRNTFAGTIGNRPTSYS